MDLGTKRAAGGALWVIAIAILIWALNQTYLSCVVHDVRKNGLLPPSDQARIQSEKAVADMNAVVSDIDAKRKKDEYDEMSTMANQYPDAGITANMAIQEARGRRDIAIEKRLAAARGGN